MVKFSLDIWKTNIVYGLYKNKDWCDGRLGCFSDGTNCLFTICVRCADCNSAAANNAMPVEIAGTELSQTFYILNLIVLYFTFYNSFFTFYICQQFNAGWDCRDRAEPNFCKQEGSQSATNPYISTQTSQKIALLGK